MVIVTTLVVYSRRTNPSPSAPILRGSILSIRNRHFSSFWSPAINHLGSSHVVQVLHGQEVHVEESIDAVGQAALLASIELGVLDAASDALVPADLGQAMCFCSPIVSAQASGYHHRWGGGGLLTRLDLRSLLLVGEELAEVALVLVVEPLKVGVLELG